MQNRFYLHQKLAADTTPQGIIKGVAYSGGVIEEHGYIENLIIDVATLTIAKPKTPIFRDHMPSQVAGNGTVTISDNQVLIEGKLSQKSIYGKEIMELSSDGFEWELSIGIFGGEMIEITNEEINGVMIEHGYALKNGILREVSVVALGADMNTSAEMFSQKKGELKFMLTKEQWVKLACGCGGTEKTTPEELENKFAVDQEKIDALEKENDELKAKIAANEAAIAAEKEEEEVELRAKEISTALSEKGIEGFSEEEVKKASLAVESTNTLLSLIKVMPEAKKAPKVIEQKFAAKESLSEGKVLSKDDHEAIRLQAEQLVKDGKAKDFLSAINLVEVK